MRPRDSLIVPLAIIVSIGFLASLAEALYRNDVQVLLVASGPFGLLCGYVFGVSIKRNGDA